MTYKKILLVICLLLLLSGCVDPYDYNYFLKLENQNNEVPLQYKDHLFIFDFSPVSVEGLDSEGYYRNNLLGITAEIKNKTNNDAKIIWDEAIFISVDGYSDRAIPGSARYEDSGKEILDTIIPSKLKIKEIIVPYKNLNNATIEPILEINLFKEKEEIEYYNNKTFRIILPIEINNEIKKYDFTFKIKIIRKK